MNSKLFKKDQEEKFFLTIDIGTEAVKCVIFYRIPDSEKITVLGAGLEYFNRYGVFNSRDRSFEFEMIEKAIKEAIRKAYYKLSFSSVEKRIKESALDKKNWQILVSLPPDIFKARIISQHFQREEGISHQNKQNKTKSKISLSEEKAIYKSVLGIIQRNVSERFAQESGILPRDISWVFCDILEMKIDGYQVAALNGHEGEEIELKVLISFTPSYYLDSIKKIINSLGFNNFKIVHLAESIDRLFNKEKTSAMILDVGGETTQIFGIKDGKLRDIKEFKGGGRPFIRALSEVLGLSEESSRVMAERHSKERIEKVKEIFLWEKDEWYNNFKAKLDGLRLKGVFPSNILLLGGGSLLPEIKGVLMEKKDDLSASRVESVGLKDLENIEDTLRILDNAQWIPSLLICYNINR